MIPWLCNAIIYPRHAPVAFNSFFEFAHTTRCEPSTSIKQQHHESSVDDELLCIIILIIWWISPPTPLRAQTTHHLNNNKNFIDCQYHTHLFKKWEIIFQRVLYPPLNLFPNRNLYWIINIKHPICVIIQ